MRGTNEAARALCGAPAQAEEPEAQSAGKRTKPGRHGFKRARGSPSCPCSRQAAPSAHRALRKDRGNPSRGLQSGDQGAWRLTARTVATVHKTLQRQLNAPQVGKLAANLVQLAFGLRPRLAAVRTVCEGE